MRQKQIMDALVHDLTQWHDADWGEESDVVIPAGTNLHDCELELRNATFSQIHKVSIQRNGTEITSWTGDEIVMLRDYEQMTHTSKYCRLPLRNLNARSKEGVLLSEIPLYTNVETKLVILWKQNAGATVRPVCRARVWLRGRAEPEQLVVRWRKKQIKNNSMGEFEWYWDEPGANRYIMQLHVKHEIIDEISEIQFWRQDADGERKLTSWTQETMMRDLDELGKAPQNGYFHIDFGAHGFLGDGTLPTDGNLKLKFICGDVGKIDLLIKELQVKGV